MSSRYPCPEGSRQVLQRRAARRGQTQYQQSIQTEQYQNVPSQPPVSSSYYSNITEDSRPYQSLTEAADTTSKETTYEYSNIEQPSRHKSITIHTTQPYDQLKVRYTSEKTITTGTDAVETTRKYPINTYNLTMFSLQPSKTITYSDENVTQQEAPISQGYDSLTTNQQVVGTSVPTGTVEYTRQAYYTEEPISEQTKTTEYLEQGQSLDNNLQTNEQYVPQQPLPVQIPSDSGNDDDAQEDQELLYLRSCVCSCYAKFKDAWNKDQQIKYEQQFHDVQQPISVLQPPVQQYIPSPCPPCPPCPQIDIPYAPPPQYIPPAFSQYIPPPVQQYIAPPCPPCPQVDIPYAPPPQYIPPAVSQYIPPPVQQYIAPPCPPCPQVDIPYAPPPQYIPPAVSQYIPPPVQQYIAPPCPPCPQVDIPYAPPPQYIPPEIPQYISPPVQQYIPPPPVQQYVPPPCPPCPPCPVCHQPIIQPIQVPQPCVEYTPPRLIQEYVPPPRLIQEYVPPSPVEEYIPPPQFEEYIPPPVEEYIPPPPIQEYIPPPPVQQYIPPVQQYIPPPCPPCPEIIPPPAYIPPIPPPIRIPPRPIQQPLPYIDREKGVCVVPCPETIKYQHLPPAQRPELFCAELPPPVYVPPPPPVPAYIPPPPPPPPPPPAPAPAPVVVADRWCIKCCCNPGQSLIKKNVYREIEEGGQQEEESYLDYASIIDQLETKITVRYGNSFMEEGEAFVCGNYNEQLRIIDFPVYVSGIDSSDMTPLVPNS